MNGKNIFFTIVVVCMSIFQACAQQPTNTYIAYQQKVASNTVLLNNENNTVPLVHLEKHRIVAIAGSIPTFEDFLVNLRHYTAVNQTTFGQMNTSDVDPYNLFVLAVSDDELADDRLVEQIVTLSKRHSIIIVGFGSQQALAKLDQITAPIIWSEDKTAVSAKTSAEILFGGVAATARLSNSISSRYKAGSGYTTGVTRLQYSIPEAVGMDGRALTKKIDAIAAEMIEGRGAPGAVVMIVKDNKVIFDKAYGSHTYDKEIPDKVTDLFDLASVSKIVGTTLAVMHLNETGKIDLQQTMGHYLKEARKTNKKDVILRDVMLHQAGFIPYIPFYRALKESDHSADSSAAYPTKVAEGYYLKKGYFNDIMWPQMLNSPIKPAGNYVYSDISMYVMQKVVEKVSRTPLDQYVTEHFFKPLGMKDAGYNPWRRYDPSEIIPTEDDVYFRKSRLIGYVHDQGAGMAGGVAGHAGLFATANDLAIYAQMLLNRGTYGGVQFFKPETVDLYTSKQGTHSRRGLGFDRKDPDPKKEYPSLLAPASTFGHTGYTGTCIWIDPQNQLTYIFLSNRVQPEVSDKIYEMNIRSRIQDAIYEAIEKIK